MGLLGQHLVTHIPASLSPEDNQLWEQIHPLIAVNADVELIHLPTWRCPMSVQSQVRPANALRSGSLGQRNFGSWVNSASAMSFRAESLL